jgi:hypothetical protein
MRAEHTALDDRGQRRRYDHTGEHGLVERTHDLFDRERDRGDRRVEGRGDARCGSDRDQPPAVAGRESPETTERTSQPAADLHRRPLATERRAGADLQARHQQLAESVA